MGGYFKDRRVCTACGEPFWGTRRARFCTSSCRGRAARARVLLRGMPEELRSVCQVVLGRPEHGGSSYAKLLPLLFRVVARELRLRGWDPINLLFTCPDEPVSEEERGEGRPTRKWLFCPEEELAKLEREIAQRYQQGRAYDWHVQRREKLLAIVQARHAKDAQATTAAAASGADG